MARGDECPTCGAASKVCLNCRLYDINAHHQCKENNAEWVREKDRSNFCDYFIANGLTHQKDKNTETMSKLDSLFSKHPDPNSESKPKIDSLEDLFKK